MTPAASLPPPFHPRLTVVRVDAPAAGTARALADALAAQVAPGTTAIGGETVLTRARALAAAAYERRMADRTAAVAHRSTLAAKRTHLLERAQWCESTGGTARALTAALADATTKAAEARAALEAATARRDRVSEQRAAAAAAVEEARLELESLDGAALDETGVRREIEAANRAEQEARAALALAEAQVEAISGRLAEIRTAEEALAAERDRLLAEAAQPDAVTYEARVREALEVYDELAERSGLDPGATALADAIRHVDAELASLRRSVPEPPTDADLERAEAAVAAARRNLDAVRAAAAAFDGPPPQWWVELNALHAEVVDAETALTVSGLRKGSARRRYEEALAAERARLDELGFGSYLDALMSGGRLPDERVHDEQAIAEAGAALTEAERHLEQLRADLLAGAPVIERLAERERLLEVATGLLGTDPGDKVLELLAEHPAVPPMVIGELADTLRAVGVRTTGVGVAAAARAWLADREALRDPNRIRELEHRLAELAAERNAAEQALGPARAVAERSASEAQAAARTVAGLEGELRARVGDDGRLFERATAASALRDAVEALEARLAASETEALQAWTAAADALAAAEAEQQRIERDLADLGRRAAKAAADLPPERRPAFDVATNLVPLAGALRAEAAILADELASADAAVTAAELAAAAGPSNPTPQDLEDALAAVVTSAPSTAVLVEPLAGVAADAVEPLLDALLRASGERPVVVVTADLAIVGWAIGLPGETGSLVPARSLDALLHTAAYPSHRVAD